MKDIDEILTANKKGSKVVSNAPGVQDPFRKLRPARSFDDYREFQRALGIEDLAEAKKPEQNPENPSQEQPQPQPQASEQAVYLILIFFFARFPFATNNYFPILYFGL